MRALRLAAALAVLLSLAASAKDPENAACPLMRGKPLRPGVTSTYEGHVIGWCCNKCKARFDADPKGTIAANPGLAEMFKDASKGPEVGKKAPDIVLKDTDGKDVKVADLKGKIVVLEWLSPADKSSSRLAKDGLVNKLARDLKAAKDDVVFYPVCSTDGVDAKAWAKFLADNKVEGKGLIDADGAVAKSLMVSWTPLALVIDGEGTVRYAGSPDDDADGKKAAKATNYVLAAVKSLVAGEKVATETSKVYGTELKLKK